MTTTPSTRRLGANGPDVFPIALGCMGMSGMYGQADATESLATIHAAIDRGINLLDTGDFYGSGHNEMLIGRALHGSSSLRDRVLLSVKFGALRTPDGGWGGVDTRPAAIRNFVAYSLQRFRTDHIDIYRPSRLDPQVPIEDTVGAIADLIKAGYVRYLGLSEVGADTIRRAHAVHPVVDLQIEYSLISRSSEKHILPTLQELGISVTAYGVLSRGLLAGSLPAGRDDFRAYLPRFQSGNLQQNEKLIHALRRVAEARGATPAQIAIAWAMAKSESIVPVIGSRTRQQLDDALQGATLTLTPEDVRHIETAVPAEAVAGTRYDPHQMTILDSER